MDLSHGKNFQGMIVCVCVRVCVFMSQSIQRFGLIGRTMALSYCVCVCGFVYTIKLFRNLFASACARACALNLSHDGFVTWKEFKVCIMSCAACANMHVFA